jgi:hypothetical protein
VNQVYSADQMLTKLAVRVRFAPDSGLNSDIAPCPKRAIVRNGRSIGQATLMIEKHYEKD